MDIFAFREYVLSLPNVEECMPFDDVTLVYKIGGRMFACAHLEQFSRVVVHHSVERGEELHDMYAEIQPAWHFNKRYWSDVSVRGDIPDAFIRELIRESYIYTIRNNVTPKTMRERLLSEME